MSVVWQESQRALNERWANAIAERFDPDLFAPIDVTLPNGNGVYHVIDGQHRVAAAKKALGEDQLIPCHVHEVTDPAVAADLFSRINRNRKRMSQIEDFRTAVTAGYNDEVAVNKIVNDNGYTVGFNSLSSISCPAALLNVYRRLGSTVLNQTLHVLSAAYGSADAMIANNVKGFGAFLAEYPHASLGRLVQAVKKRYPDHGQLAAAAKQFKDVNGINGADKAVMAILVGAYNRSRGAKLRIPA